MIQKRLIKALKLTGLFTATEQMQQFKTFFLKYSVCLKVVPIAFLFSHLSKYKSNQVFSSGETKYVMQANMYALYKHREK